MWDVEISDTTGKKVFEFDTVLGNTVIVFVRSGSVEVQGRTKLGPQDVALFNRDQVSTKVVLRSLEKGPSRVLILAGAPIDEPISAQGPFVMNTRQEIVEANEDYQNGRNGF